MEQCFSVSSSTFVTPAAALYSLFRSANTVSVKNRAFLQHGMILLLILYLILSPHNRDCTRDHSKSASSADMYHFALEKGFGCVEFAAETGKSRTLLLPHMATGSNQATHLRTISKLFLKVISSLKTPFWLSVFLIAFLTLRASAFLHFHFFGYSIIGSAAQQSLMLLRRSHLQMNFADTSSSSLKPIPK